MKTKKYLLIITLIVIILGVTTVFVVFTFEGKKIFYNIVSPKTPDKTRLNSYLERCPISDGFDFPVGAPNARDYYNAQGFGGKNFHLGEDWNGLGGSNTDFGDPVYAVANGIVIYSKHVIAGWGNIIRVVHNTGTKDSPKYVESFYAHLNKMLVKEGDIVSRGQKIGTIGNVNGLYYAHLHFEMRSKINMPVSSGYSDNTTGYINPTKYIMNSRPKIRVLKNGIIKKIRKNNVNLRYKPHIKSRILNKLDRNNNVTIVSKGKYVRIGKLGIHNWYNVKWKNKIGWVYGAYLK